MPGRTKLLRRCGEANIQCAVVTGSVSHVRLNDVEKCLVARPIHAVRKVVWMRRATLTGDRINGLNVIRTIVIEKLVRHCDHFVFAHTWLKLVGDFLVGAVDDCR